MGKEGPEFSGLEARVIEVGRDLHQHPELSNRETRTAFIVAEKLSSLGLEVRTGVAKTGVVGVLRGALPGPVVALRADMDALPLTEETGLPFASKVRTQYAGQEVGVRHACGHDAHTAILLGVAELLAGLREKLAGSVVFVFQPAEEGPPPGEEGGAPLMLKEQVFADPKPEPIFALHTDSELAAGEVAVVSGPAMASSDRLRIVVRGRGAQASAPWRGAGGGSPHCRGPENRSPADRTPRAPVPAPRSGAGPFPFPQPGSTVLRTFSR